MEKLADTELLGENLPRRHLVNHKSHLPDPGANPGSRGRKPATNRLSYGAAVIILSLCSVSNCLHSARYKMFQTKLLFSRKSFELNVERGYCSPTGLKVS
jgi:hypothetical protein